MPDVPDVPDASDVSDELPPEIAELLDGPPMVLAGPPVPGVKFSEDGLLCLPTPKGDVYERLRLDGFVSFDDDPLRWLWPGYIPIGKVTLIEGEGNVGKTFLAADIAARVSRGQPWPGAVPGPQLAGDVIYVCGEDDINDTLGPRLKAMGADLMRVTPLSVIGVTDSLEHYSVRRLNFPDDLKHLEHLLRRLGQTRLVVVDSLSEHCANDKAFRAALRELEEIARRRNVAIVVTSRPPRSGTTRTRKTHWRSDPVRCQFQVLPDPEGEPRVYLAPVRMTFASEPAWLAFRIANRALAWEPPLAEIPESARPPNPAREKAGALQDAVEWLKEQLRDDDQPAKRCKKQAAECGISEATLRRARLTLGVRCRRVNEGLFSWWVWSLKDTPHGAAPPDDTALETRISQPGPTTAEGAPPPPTPGKGGKRRGVRNGTRRGNGAGDAAGNGNGHANGNGNGKSSSAADDPLDEFAGPNFDAMTRQLVRQILTSGGRM